MYSLIDFWLFSDPFGKSKQRCSDGGRWSWLETNNALRHEHTSNRSTDCSILLSRLNTKSVNGIM